MNRPQQRWRPLARRSLAFTTSGLLLSLLIAWLIPIIGPSYVTSRQWAWTRIGGTLWFLNCERRPGLRYWQLDAMEFLDPHADQRSREDTLTSWYRQVQKSEAGAEPQLLDSWTRSFMHDLSTDRYSGAKTVDVVETGLPFPSLMFVIAAAPEDWSHRMEHPVLHRGWSIGSGGKKTSIAKPILPLHPRWGGLLLNAAACAFATAITFYTARAAVRGVVSTWTYRSRSRMRRGLCPKCAYDLTHNLDSGCPECGWGRAKPPSALPRGER